MSPYADSDELRHSAENIIRIVMFDPVCSCGSKNKMIGRKNIESYPQLPFECDGKHEIVKSTADVYECPDCGTVIEIAWSLTCSMCVAKDTSSTDD